MPRASSGNAPEFIQHCVGVRTRVTGTGNFLISILSYDEVKTQSLAAIALQTATDIEPTVLANFKSQRMKVLFETEEYDEIFTLTKLIPFTKPFAKSYPQGV